MEHIWDWGIPTYSHYALLLGAKEEPKQKNTAGETKNALLPEMIQVGKECRVIGNS